MAEPTTVDNGSLTDYDVAVDDLGADGVAGLAKLLVSADGSSARIPADAANGLDVDVTRVQGTVTVGGTVALSGTSPVSAASLPLPSGAATAVKQPAPGVAGTPSSDVLTVQGIASGTVLPVSDGGGSLTVDGTVAVSGTVAVTDNSGSLTVDNAALSVTGGGVESGALRVTLATDSTGVVSVDDNGASLTVDGTVAATQSGTWNVGTVTSVTNVVHVDDNSSTLSVDDGGGSLTVDGTVAVSGTVAVTDNSGSLTVDNGGTFATQVDGAALTSLQLIDDIVYTDDTSTHATGTSKGALIMAAAAPTDTAVNANDIGAVAMTTDRKLHVSVQDALPAGTAAIGKLAANSGVDIGDVDVTSVSGTVTVGGVAATDAAVSGNPVLAAGRASTAIPTAMSADGDVVPIWLDRNGALVVTPRFGATSTLSNVAASATSANLLASNTSRRSATIVNDSASRCLVKEGTTASATSFTWLLNAYDTLVLDGSYSGAVDAIWDTATGNARITERT